MLLAIDLITHWLFILQIEAKLFHDFLQGASFQTVGSYNDQIDSVDVKDVQ
jgi:hypothetical protein